MVISGAVQYWTDSMLAAAYQSLRISHARIKGGGATEHIA